MSLGWKKFNFYEHAELDQLGLPEDLTCGAAEPDDGLFLGAATGTVSIVDPSLAPRLSFKAHQHAVLQLTYLVVSTCNLATATTQEVCILLLQIHSYEMMVYGSSPSCLEHCPCPMTSTMS